MDGLKHAAADRCQRGKLANWKATIERRKTEACDVLSSDFVSSHWLRCQIYAGGIQCSSVNPERTRCSTETVFWVKTRNFQYETRFRVRTTFPLRKEICSKQRFLNWNLKFELKLAIYIYVFCTFRSYWIYRWALYATMQTGREIVRHVVTFEISPLLRNCLQ